jgi:hypothetical protein
MELNSEIKWMFSELDDFHALPSFILTSEQHALVFEAWEIVFRDSFCFSYYNVCFSFFALFSERKRVMFAFQMRFPGGAHSARVGTWPSHASDRVVSGGAARAGCPQWGFHGLAPPLPKIPW